MDKLFAKRNFLKKQATLLIVGLMVLNTFIIIFTGGIPSAFAHTMYIPILIAALFHGPYFAMIAGIFGGVLVGPTMMLVSVDVGTEPLANSAYRTLYFIGLGGVLGLLFQNLLNRINTLHIQAEELSATLMSIGDGVIITDEHATIVNVNDIAAQLIGISENEAIGKTLDSMFTIVNEYSKKPVSNPAKMVIKKRKRVEIASNTILIDCNGNKRHIEDSASPIHDKEGKLIGVVIVFRDVTEQKNREKEILHISYHDYLTDIPNRRYFQKSLDALDNNESYPLGIVLMDLNGLKVVNDAYGHSHGNIVLKRVAKILNEVKTSSDIIARIGGDEFAMLCPNSNEEGIQIRLEKIKELLSLERIGNIEFSLAMGHTFKTATDQKIRDVLREAEDLMYKHKIIAGKSTKNKAIMSILQTLTEKFHEEKIHAERVAKYCRMIGEKMGLRTDEVNELELAGMLHDIGKISIPDAILQKPSKLNKDEMEQMQQHTMSGYQILRAADDYSNLAEYAMSHHERIDGQGYPNGLKGSSIPLFARIISVADAFEAMTSDRCYREALSLNNALNELKENAGTQFDEDVVQCFVSNVIDDVERVRNLD